MIANRGEIAVRIIRTLQRLHIASVAVFADDDAKALHRRLADEACPLGGGTMQDTYLNVQKIIDAALDTGAEAVHPGYGFLSESPELAAACEANNLIFIGPDARSIRLMGNKIAARQVAIEKGIPVAFGCTGSMEEIMGQAASLPYPVLIKAAAGGGGKGMHIVSNPDELEPALRTASREAERFFNDGTVFVEQYLEKPRHIEVQVLADHFGNIIHLHERECTIQRRYQKIIEESPSPTLNDEKRGQLYDAAIRLCKAIGYKNAGTVEFLVDKALNFYFLEMNTRIQVEHPVTEQCTGIDIVEEQIRIARGKEMGYCQEDIKSVGHAIELRIYAENPENGFLPAPGQVTAYHEPQIRGARVDSSIDGKCFVSSAYDPMVAKLTCHAKDRQHAIDSAERALNDFILQGLTTNKAYLWEILRNRDYFENQIDTSYCKTHHEDLLKAVSRSRETVNLNDVVVAFLLFDCCKTQIIGNARNVWETIGYWRYQMDLSVMVDDKPVAVHICKTHSGKLEGRVNQKPFSVEWIRYDSNQLKIMLNGRTENVYCSVNDVGETIVNLRGLNFTCRRSDHLNDIFDYSRKNELDHSMNLLSPMPGKVVKVNVAEGQVVKAGTVLVVVEAMKMENNIIATADAHVKRICVAEGEKVDNKTQLIELEKMNETENTRDKSRKRSCYEF